MHFKRPIAARSTVAISRSPRSRRAGGHMKIHFAWLLFFTGPLWAVTPPYLLGDLKGVVLTSLTDRESFELLPGETKDCTKKIVVDQIWYYCGLQGTSVKISSHAGTPMDLKLDMLLIRNFTRDGKLYRYFKYSGSWKGTQIGQTIGSDAELELWAPFEDMATLTGRVSLTEFGTAAAVTASAKAAK